MSDHPSTRDTTDPASTRNGDADDPNGTDRLSPSTAATLDALADRIDSLADSFPIGAARHHARRAAAAARTTADGDTPRHTRRVAVGELVTELRTAADEAEATRAQYELLQVLYEEALPATREASADIYG